MSKKPKMQDKGAMGCVVAPYTRRELVLLAVVLAAGFAARIWAVSHAAVEHFDEGVYASNIYFGEPDYAYPKQRFYAPPLLPALIEAGMIAGLPPNLAALLPSFLAGCGTIAALWWFGRSWFGPEVGLAAAALVALNDFHIAFSATALTDVLLGLWLVLAVDAIGRSLLSGDFRWAVVAGIYTGLAWWTKYNGWLPLAIEAAALPVLWFFLRPPGRELRAWLTCLAITAVVATAVWSPYFVWLQSHGGYGPIAANHAKYVVGLAGWLGSAARQASNQYGFGAWLTIGGVLLAAAMPALLERRGWWETLSLLRWLGAGIVGVTLVSVMVTSVGAALGMARILAGFHLAQKLDPEWRRRTIGFALVGVWWGGMLLATPLYAPYPRLALPYLLAAALATAVNVAEFFPVVEREFYQTRLGRFWQGVFFASVAAALLALGVFIHRRELPSERRGILRIAHQVQSVAAAREPRVIYVAGEPALYFQLRAAGEEIVSAVQDVPTAAATLDGRPIPTLLIVGPHAQRDPRFLRQLAAARDRWELVQEFDYHPSAVVWLDLNHPRSSHQATADDDRVRLFRWRP